MEDDRFDGMARAFADRGEDRAPDRDQYDTLRRLATTKGSRRLALAGLSAGALFARSAQLTNARCRAKDGKNKRRCRRNGKSKRLGGVPCQDKLFGVCVAPSLFLDGEICCNNMACEPTINPLVTACQWVCETDDDCKKKFPNKALACRTDVLVCPFRAIGGEKCCVPR